MCSILAYCSQDADCAAVAGMLSKTASRGPDDSRILRTPNGYLGFNRLSIMGLTPEGMQPFVLGAEMQRDAETALFKMEPSSGRDAGRPGSDADRPESAAGGSEDKGTGGLAVVCNGELYGFRGMRDDLLRRGYSFASDSDCEILLPMYREFDTMMFRMLDAEFALILYDAEKKIFIAARDPVGIRPLYYGKDDRGFLIFASEAKNLVGVCRRIMPFPPGHYAVVDAQTQKMDLVEYRRIWEARKTDRGDGAASLTVRPGEGKAEDELDQIVRNIHDKLSVGIEKRLDADAPVGFLLSGGLDSSLVCGVAARLIDRPLQTFSIGMDVDAIDLKYARKVAEYIHSDHHEVIMTREDVLGSLKEVIAALGTWDITTIRASIGMYLVCKWIHENTDIRVILTGEVSDEIFGYKYTDFAPDAEAFQKEAEKRIREIHMYDVLRADRCISVHSLEARVPFGDLDFLSYCMSIDPEKKMNRYGIGKYLLRHAFEKDGLLPVEILMREKAAFSDAVGHSMRRDLIDYAESLYSDEEYQEKRRKYTHAMPFTKESLLYREIFEKYYPGQAQMVDDFWMPNRSWEGCDVNDPSASVLSNYGASGV